MQVSTRASDPGASDRDGLLIKAHLSAIMPAALAFAVGIWFWGSLGFGENIPLGPFLKADSSRRETWYHKIRCKRKFFPNCRSHPENPHTSWRWSLMPQPGHCEGLRRYPAASKCRLGALAGALTERADPWVRP